MPCSNLMSCADPIYLPNRYALSQSQVDCVPGFPECCSAGWISYFTNGRIMIEYSFLYNLEPDATDSIRTAVFLGMDLKRVIRRADTVCVSFDATESIRIVLPSLTADTIIPITCSLLCRFFHGQAGFGFCQRYYQISKTIFDRR